jgi:hypothetical protein
LKRQPGLPVSPNLSKIGPSDLKDDLSKGIVDFSAMSSHRVFLRLIDTIAGIGLVASKPLPLLYGAKGRCSIGRVAAR